MLRILFTNARELTQDWRRAGFYEWIGKIGGAGGLCGRDQMSSQNHQRMALCVPP